MAEPRLRVLTPLAEAIWAQAAAELPEVEFVPIPAEGELPAEARGEVLLCGLGAFATLDAALARGVRWIHASATGVYPELLAAARGRTLTTARGWSSPAVAEFALAVMLAFAKRLPESWVHEPPERWARAELSGLSGRTLGLVGLGTIGLEVARRALAFEMRVLALRRSGAASPLAGVEVVRSLEELLPQADHLVLAAPETPATRHLVDGPALALVRRGVHLVNVGRGSLVDHDALREALDDGRVALASIDTPDPDPLPAGHWLYTHPRVRLSAHVAWNDSTSEERRHRIFVDNVRRYLAGEPLAGVVDQELGY
jgi:phosphoglycerate dehydrogenase-like enzyme